MNSWTEEEIERTLEEIRKLSLVDGEYRKLALTDPAAAVAKFNPKPLPQGYDIKFIDNSGAVKSFLLPNPVENVEELSDAELEAVAGGISNRNNAVIVEPA